MTGTLTITAVARSTGLRSSAVRYYESAGLLPAPARIGGRRRYDASIFPRLALIAAAQQMGCTIAEIAMLLHGFEEDTPASQRWQILAAKKLAEVEARIARAEQMRRLLEEALNCGCLTLDACARAFQAQGRPATGAGLPQEHPPQGRVVDDRTGAPGASRQRPAHTIPNCHG